MSDWLSSRQDDEAGFGLGVERWAELGGVSIAELTGAAKSVIALGSLAGPYETMQAAGFTNRGSLNYALKERDFPEPVKVLRGIRLWDLDAVKVWAEQHRPGGEE